MSAAQDSANRPPAACVDDVVTTADLAARRARPADHAAEARALVALAKAMADAPDAILQRLAETALDLCRAGSAGVSLAEADGDKQVFRWRAAAGAFAPFLGATLPRDFSPCGVVLDRNATQLMTDPARFYPYIDGLAPRVRELLLVPFGRGATPVGTVWVVAHAPETRFDAEDARLVASLAEFAAAALQGVRAGQTLRETEERAAFVRAAAGVGFWYCDLPFDVLEWDPLVKAHFHLPPDAVVTIDTFYARIHPADRGPTRAAIERSIADHTAYDVHYRTVADTGAERWVRAIGRTFYAPDGTPRRFDGVTMDVTPQRLAEEQLRESGRRLREFADAAPAMLWVTDPAGMCTFLSREWYAQTGQTEAEALGLGWTAATHPADQETAERVFLAANAGRTEFRLEYRLRAADGSYRWALDVGRPRFSAAGDYLGMVGSVIDIHERKVAEDELERRVADRTAELRREQTFLKAVLDNVEDGIVACDAAGVLTLFNRATRGFHGLPEESLPADQWAARYALYRGDGTTPLPRDEVPLFRALNGERVRDAEMVIAPTGGAPRTLVASGQPLFGADGAKIGAVVSMHDITDRKGREAAQARADREQERSAALRKVARASRVMSSVLNVDSIAGIVTAEARTIIGANVAATSLIAPDDPANVLHTVALSDTHGDFVPGEGNTPATTLHPLVAHATAPVRLTRKELMAHPLYHAVGKGVLGWPPPDGWLAVPLVGYSGRTIGFLQLSDKDNGEFTEDDEAVLVQLAAIAAAGIENARLYERLKEQDKRKDEFLATLAHELRNPLAPVRNGLHILRLAPAETPAAEKVREMMERQLAHLVHLVDDLLDVSRVTSGKIVLKPARVDLRAVVAAAVETSRPLIDAAGHTLTLDLPAGPLAVTGDANRLAQVLTNLLNNAAKYTPAGGAVHICAARDKDHAVLSVRDTGVGLPAEMLAKIFDMFTQVGGSLERAQGGLGIGLTLVRKLVEMHDGTVTAESPGDGQGSTFTVRLPLSSDEFRVASGEKEVKDGFSSPLATRHSPLKILVVDDNVDGAESLAMLLSITGHAVTTAHTGPAGLAAAKAARPDVVFLDIGLPGMNGYEVARHIRQDPALAGRVTLVALTGWGAEEDRQRAAEAGFDHHLTKPADADRVTALLARLRN